MRLVPTVARLVGVTTLAALLAACSTTAQSAQTTLRKSTIQRGTIDQTVSATGAVHPQERSNLSFEQPGYVTDIQVEVGSHVKAGDVLARLDSNILDLSVTQAELQLQAAQISYKRLFDPPTQAQVAAAQAAVASAVAAYHKLIEPPDAEKVKQAQYEYEQAYQEYLKNNRNDKTGVTVANLETARLNLQLLTQPPDKNAMAAAQAAIAQAQDELDALKQGPTDAVAAQAQNQVNQAQLALDRARRKRDGATLVAPYEGIVSVVNIDPGALAPSSVPAVVVVDAAHLHVEVDVDEIDIGKIAVGQPAVVTFDALPNQQAQGQVTNITPSSTSSSGVVTYSVRIDLAPTNLPIRSGMTSTADIVIKRVADTILVPNWAVRLDRATGQAYASVLGADGRLSDAPVMLGIRSTDFSQVLAGLKEGQTVAVNLSQNALSVAPNNTPTPGQGK